MTHIAHMSAFLRGDGMTMDIVWTTIVLLSIHSLRGCAIFRAINLLDGERGL